MKGIILAGGNGTRLYPITQIYNKCLLPVYDKPMIYYPLCTLIENGIKDICIISSPENINNYKILLKNINDIGVNVCFEVQEKPEGIAQAFLIAENFIKGEKVTLILGDNIFSGGQRTLTKAFRGFTSGAIIFGYEVKDPERYGVVNFKDNDEVMSVVEKPKEPKSNFAIPGLYIFDENVLNYARQIKPSERKELEITSVINLYLENNKLKAFKLNRGCAWLDAGTPKSLHESSEYVKVIEERQGIKIGCIEEAAYNSKFINKKELIQLAANLPKSEYKEYLTNIR